MNFKGVIFDLDGTLLNTDLYVCCNYAHIFEKYHLKNMPSLNEMVYFSGPPLVEIFKRYLPNENIEDLKQEFTSYSLEHANNLSSLYPDEIETLTNLKNNGIKIGLVTNKGKVATIDCLNYWGLSKYFDSIFYLEKCEKPKPDGWPLINCAKELNLDINLCLYVGDDKYDIIAGHNANMKTCLVQFGLKKGLEKYNPYYIANSYKEVERIIKDGK